MLTSRETILAALHPSQLWWLATVGSARALRIEDKVGNLAAGMEADLVAIDLSAPPPAIAQRSGRAAACGRRCSRRS